MEKHRCYGCMELTDAEVCPQCGWHKDQDNEPHQLPVGTVLRDKYLIGRVLGQGGFGITYMAWDMDLELQVCVKEFYPSTAVNRDSTHNTAVTCNTSAMEAGFLASRERFLREARSLAKFREIPQIVSLYDFFQMNNTAYMVMEFVKGIDMAKLIRNRGGRLSMEEILRILDPVMDALQKVHEAGLIHRDISPDNIMLHPLEGAKLLDFGAVRTVASPDPEKELTRSTEAILKNGFAPMEQYVEKGSLGPWTDVYAMSASIFYCLTGRIPESAPSRMLEDEPFDWTGAQGITEEQKEVIARGMALKAKDRIGSIRELKEALLAAAAPVAAMPEASEAEPEPMVVTEGIISAPPQEEIATPANEVPVEGISADETVSEKASDDETMSGKAAPQKKTKLLPVMATALILVLLGAGLWFLSRVQVTGVELDDSTLDYFLMDDHSAIGYYTSSAILPLSDTAETVFPIGDAYNGMLIIIASEKGAYKGEYAANGVVKAELPVGGTYLLQVLTADTEHLGWTQWSETLPEDIDLNEATVEVDIQYRDRKMEYAESNRPTMDGWELYETVPSTMSHGEWSQWSEAKLEADPYSEVESQHQYRTSSYETTSSDQPELEGWTHEREEYTYTYGAWSGLQEGAIQETSTLEVEVQVSYRYPVSVWRNGYYRYDGVYWMWSSTVPAGTTAKSWYEGDDHHYYIVLGPYNSTRNYYRSRTRYLSSITHYYSRWTDWTEWTTESAEATDTLRVEERDVYRIREIYGEESFRFFRWMEWGLWSLDAPGPENEEHEYEQRIVYRYIPQ